MTEAEALAALGPPWSAGPGSNDSCRVLSPGDDGAATQSYEVRGGRVVGARVDDYAPQTSRTTVATERGVGLGSSERQVRLAYPEGLQDLPANITGHSRVLRTAADHSRAIQFLLNDQGTVVSIAAGEPSVFGIEGCG